MHAPPSALCPHVEWAVGGVLGTPTDLSWTPQPARTGTYRTEFSWTGAVGTGPPDRVGARGWERLLFEVTEDSTPRQRGRPLLVHP